MGALYLAQLIQMALRDGPDGLSPESPEQLYSRQPQVGKSGASQAAPAAATSALLAGGFALSRIRRIADRPRN